MWSFIHKVVVVNEWRGGILVEIDNNCFHCGSQFVESVEHIFFNCPLTQQVQRYVANIMWQLFARISNLGP